jgi:hypothetical protein
MRIRWIRGFLPVHRLQPDKEASERFERVVREVQEAGVTPEELGAPRPPGRRPRYWHAGHQSAHRRVGLGQLHHGKWNAFQDYIERCAR